MILSLEQLSEVKEFFFRPVPDLSIFNGLRITHYVILSDS